MSEEDDDKTKQKVKALTHQKLELINRMTQCIVLILISFMTSIGFILLAAIGIPLLRASALSYRSGLSLYIYAYWTIIMDMFINSICLFLHFSFSMTFYKAICLKSLHKVVLLMINKCFFYRYK